MFDNPKLVKRDSGCVGGDCAAMVAVDNAPVAFERRGEPGYLIQGEVDLTPDELEAGRKIMADQGVGQAAHEGIVWVPANVINGD